MSDICIEKMLYPTDFCRHKTCSKSQAFWGSCILSLDIDSLLDEPALVGCHCRNRPSGEVARVLFGSKKDLGLREKPVRRFVLRSWECV